MKLMLVCVCVCVYGGALYGLIILCETLMCGVLLIKFSPLFLLIVLRAFVCMTLWFEQQLNVYVFY